MPSDELDGVTVAPDIHRVVFESRVTRLEITIQAGTTTPARHLDPTVTYRISGSDFVGGTARQHDVRLAAPTPCPAPRVVHSLAPRRTIENTGDDLVVIGVELKHAQRAWPSRSRRPLLAVDPDQRHARLGADRDQLARSAGRQAPGIRSGRPPVAPAQVCRRRASRRARRCRHRRLAPVRPRLTDVDLPSTRGRRSPCPTSAVGRRPRRGTESRPTARTPRRPTWRSPPSMNDGLSADRPVFAVEVRRPRDARRRRRDQPTATIQARSTRTRRSPPSVPPPPPGRQDRTRRRCQDEPSAVVHRQRAMARRR